MKKAFDVVVVVSVWFVTKCKDHPVIVTVGILGVILSTLLDLHNGLFDAVSKYELNNNQKTFITKEKKPLFISKSSKDSVNIIVARFENYYNPNISNCIGNAITQRINQVSYSKQLPINVLYNDSLISPKTVTEAKKLATINNGDIIIFGLFMDSNNQCGNGKVCFRTTANSFMKSSADSSNAQLEKYDLNFKDIKSGQIELGQFTLDTLAFDYWIESLVVLKKDRKYFSGFRNLYKIPINISLKDKFEKYRERATMNANLGLFYKAISDFDSSSMYFEKYVKQENKKIAFTQDMFESKNGELPEGMRIILKNSKQMFQNQYTIFNLFYNKVMSLAMLGKEKEAIRQINAKLAKINQSDSLIKRVGDNSIYKHKEFEQSKRIFSVSTAGDSLGNVEINLEGVENELYYLKSYIYYLSGEVDSMYSYIPYARGTKDCEKYYALYSVGAFIVEKNYEKTIKIIEDSKRTGCRNAFLNPDEFICECLIMIKYDWFIKESNLFLTLIGITWSLSIFTSKNLFLASIKQPLYDIKRNRPLLKKVYANLYKKKLNKR